MRLAVVLIAALVSANTIAESKRIEVYATSQAYVDVKAGDTLGEIVKELLPNTPKMRKNLMREIVALNPDSFIGGDLNMLKANTRLWLPGHVSGLRTQVDRTKYKVKEFSWGYIQQAR